MPQEREMDKNTEPQSVNDKIYSCLNIDQPKSFFLFAGAGSGKTRCLVDVLTRFRKEKIEWLNKRAKRVAIITYTNAACDEIKHRLDFDNAFHVSTIHSFAWELINPYTNDIREYIRTSLKDDIEDLEGKQARAKSKTTKTYIDRSRRIASKKKRLVALNAINKFTYNPNGDNVGRDSLSHPEVISIAADFIMNRALMQSILVGKYPILLIDESQDTKKELMNAFFKVQENKSDCFTLGMFGDTMQRIYTDGKPNLGESIPDSWAKPAKTINYRCPKRILRLINRIRSNVDGQEQQPNKNEEGAVRLFIVDARQSVDKAQIEIQAMKSMAESTGDPGWISSPSAVKVLTLEHHMAAARGGFSAFFDPLYAVDKFKTGLLDGTLSGVSFLARQILPLVEAKSTGDEFKVTSIVRRYSSLLKRESLKASEQPLGTIRAAGEAVSKLYSLCEEGNDPSLREVLRIIRRTGLFQIPEALNPIAERLVQDNVAGDEPDDAELDPGIEAWEAALQCPLSRFKEYVKYISDESQFGTHQGIKGLQFPRVMVILDDEESRGFLFSYEKLFGAKDPSERDLQNEADGKETSIDRTRRLFYVTCSRAEKSLAIMAYTKNCQRLRQYALEQNWFTTDEIIIIGEGLGNA